MTSLYEHFAQQGEVEKTLKFELIPTPATLDFIKERNLLEQDQVIKDSYALVRGLCDDAHREYIEWALSQASLEGLEEYKRLHLSKDKADKKTLKTLQKTLRKQVAKSFEATPELAERKESLLSATLFKAADKGGILLGELGKRPQENEQLVEAVKRFHKFGSYFTSYHTVRKNLYKDEKASSIAHRVVNDNLPRYIENEMRWEQILEKVEDDEWLRKLTQLVSNHNPSALKIEEYNRCLTQTGIDGYNALIGKINQISNEYNQYKQTKVLPKLRPLHKQLLSDQSKDTQGVRFEDDKQVALELLANQESLTVSLELIDELLARLPYADPKGVYVAPNKVGQLSHQVLKDHSIIDQAIELHVRQTLPRHKNPTRHEENVKKELANRKKQKHSIAQLDEMVSEFLKGREGGEEFESFVPFLQNRVNSTKELQYGLKTELVFEVRRGFEEVADWLFELAEGMAGVKNLPKMAKSRYQEQLDKVASLKAYLDSWVELLRHLRYVQVPEVQEYQDEEFYQSFVEYAEDLAKVAKLYDRVRNYVTQAVYSREKLKLNFNNASFLSGWALSREKINLSFLMRREDKYYLAVYDKDSKDVLDNAPEVLATDGFYEKMEYRQVNGAKGLTKTVFAKSKRHCFPFTAEIDEIVAKGSHLINVDLQKNPDFVLEDCHKMIDFLKACIEGYDEWSVYGFEFSQTSSYTCMNDFYKEFDAQSYAVKFVPYHADYIEQLVEAGELYLFEIHNQDFKEKAKGKPSLHTMYFKELFSDENLQNALFKLNGGAEMFFRPASLSLEETTIHRKGDPMYSKRNPGKPVGVYHYDIIKDRRFTQDKFFLHIPITLNYGAQDFKLQRLNALVYEALQQQKVEDIHVMGISRGETHLLYVTIVNHKGEIVHQESLNTIVSYSPRGDRIETDYHAMLEKRANERQEARQSWGAIESIKNLKEGYLSQAMHKLIKLMLEYNAVIALEDLESSFINSRIKVEKAVYKRFETALLTKLQFVVDKDRQAQELAGVRNALQLTAPSDSNDPQNGFVNFINSAYTARIDSNTGFVWSHDMRYKNVQNSRLLLEMFEGIRYNAQKDWFEFDVFDETAQKKWRLCSYDAPRYLWKKAKGKFRGGYVLVEVTKGLKELLDKAGVEYQDGRDLVAGMVAVEQASFYRGVLEMIQALTALKYKANKGSDFHIYSPVQNAKGQFFTTDTGDLNQPVNADANVAYNIARKCWIRINRIRALVGEQVTYKEMFIDNATWLTAAGE